MFENKWHNNSQKGNEFNNEKKELQIPRQKWKFYGKPELLSYVSKKGMTIKKVFGGIDRGKTAQERYYAEYKALELLNDRKLSFSVPRVIDADESNHTLVLSYIPHTCGNYERKIQQLNASQQEEILTQAAKAIRELHSQIPKPLSEKYVTSYIHESVRRLYKAKENLIREGFEFERLYKAVTGLEEFKQEIIESGGFVHGDPLLRNILFNKTQLVGVIDFEFFRHGSRYEDLAYIALMILHSQSFSRSFWKHYPLPVNLSLLARFCIAESTHYFAYRSEQEYELWRNFRVAKLEKILGAVARSGKFVPVG